jgi:hypothetical protein
MRTALVIAALGVSIAGCGDRKSKPPAEAETPPADDQNIRRSAYSPDRNKPAPPSAARPLRKTENGAEVSRPLNTP